MKPVIVVIDIDEQQISDTTSAKKSPCTETHIIELVDFGRQKDIPIIWVKEKIHLECTQPVKIQSTSTEENSDNPRSYSAFFRNEFVEVLNALEPYEIIACGCNKNACIRMTVVDAYMRDLKPIIAKDCVDAWEDHTGSQDVEYYNSHMIPSLSNEEIFRKYTL